MLTELLARAIAAFAVDGLVWGFAGFFVFRLLGGSGRWWLGILGTIVVALVQEATLFLPLVALVDLRIGNEEVSDLLGTDRIADMITFDPFSDVLVTVLAITVGFMIAGWLEDRRARRAVNPSRAA